MRTLLSLVLLGGLCGCVGGDNPVTISASELSLRGGCGAVELWALNTSETVAFVVSHDFTGRELPGSADRTFTLPDPAVKVRLLRGTEISYQTCSDVAGGSITSETAAIKGSVHVTAGPSDARGACEYTYGTATIHGVEMSDGTRIEDLTMAGDRIGCLP